MLMRTFSVQTLDQIELGEVANVVIGVGLAVRSQQDFPDASYAGGLGRGQLFPERPSTGGDVQKEHSCASLGWMPDVEGTTVGAPPDRVVAGLETRDGTRFTPFHGVKRAFLLGV